jgi:spore maturation protein CgeB
MKICFLTEYYPAYLKYFYSRYPNAALLSHSEQQQELFRDSFDWITALLLRVKEMGYEVEIIVANSEPLQQAWARENGLKFDPSNWRFTIPIEQVKKIAPDIFWIDSVYKYYGDYLSNLKEYCGYIFAWTATAYPSNLNLSAIDCMLTSHENFAEQFRNKGKKCEILLPAFEPLILDRISKEDTDSIPLSFVGGLSPQHIYRTKIISRLVEETELEVWGYQRILSKNMFKDFSKFTYAINSLMNYRKIKSRHRGEIWGLDMYKILNKSLMTINVEGEVTSDFSGNIRLFEATGSGALLITGNAGNLKNIFLLGQEVETYSSCDELVEKIGYYSAHQQERSQIAKAGQTKALNRHSTIQRGHEWLHIVEQHFSGR